MTVWPSIHILALERFFGGKKNILIRSHFSFPERFALEGPLGTVVLPELQKKQGSCAGEM